MSGTVVVPAFPLRPGSTPRSEAKSGQAFTRRSMVSAIIDTAGTGRSLEMAGIGYPFSPYLGDDIVSYEVPYKTAFFERDRCTGWEYLR